jgi:mono/diheme cytochrome c family protein
MRVADENQRNPKGPQESDVTEMHRPLFREAREPEEGREPAPWWVWVVVAMALFWGGFYLGRYGGVFAPIPHVGYERPVPAFEDPDTAPFREPVAAAGDRLYAQHCATCHQADGQGVTGVFPPLVGTDWVLADAETPVRIVLRGLVGPIEVEGVTYDGVMPGFAALLDDDAVALVVSYMRQMGANDAEPVDAALVEEVRTATADRAEPFTAEELLQLRESP